MYSQEIYFSKDSLEFNLAAHLNSYFASDTTFVVNIGKDTLLIDTIYSKKYYGYILDVSYKGLAIHHNVYLPEDTIDLSIEMGDTARFIFSNPDLCPICKSTTGFETFVDSLVIHSNSKINKNYYLYSSGIALTTGVKRKSNTTPSHYYLKRNYPNPFNPTTTISYSIPKTGLVTIRVYDVLGREITTLVNKNESAGNYSVNFNAIGLSSGIYFYRLKVGGYAQTRKMILLK